MSAFVPTRSAFDGQMSAAIDGHWKLIDGYVGGVRVPEADLSRLALTIDNGRFALGRDEGLVVVDLHAQPGLIDIVSTSGPNRGQVVPGIFECTDEALRICYDLAGTNRPTTFAAPPGTRRFVALYRRTEL